MNAFEILHERGFFYQLTDEEAIRTLLTEKNVYFYIGIDPTADSMHIGHLLPIMAARLLQKSGHTPIILLGGGTAMIGDPSGKTEMRQLLKVEEIAVNVDALKKQLKRFIEFDEKTDSTKEKNHKSFILNNLEWLHDLNYIDFLRDIGRHFSINRMLAADSVKLRLESGLSFLEFNYMLLQAYDFYTLFKNYDCILQLGGQDQWGNIVAGVDLVRRMTGRTVHGGTFPLLTDRQGRKFGKTAEGAVWLDESKTSIFDYYQFWRNIEDTEVGKLLALYTTLPIKEVRELGNLQDPKINRAKEILAYEATALAHGHDAAKKIYLAVAEQFGFADAECSIPTSSSISAIKPSRNKANLPTITLKNDELQGGIWIVKLLVRVGLADSNGAARRLIQSGGAYLNDRRIMDINKEVGHEDFDSGQLLLRSGKKNIRRLVTG